MVCVCVFACAGCNVCASVCASVSTKRERERSWGLILDLSVPIYIVPRRLTHGVYAVLYGSVWSEAAHHKYTIAIHLISDKDKTAKCDSRWSKKSRTRRTRKRNARIATAVIMVRHRATNLSPPSYVFFRTKPTCHRSLATHLPTHNLALVCRTYADTCNAILCTT